MDKTAVFLLAVQNLSGVSYASTVSKKKVVQSSFHISASELRKEISVLYSYVKQTRKDYIDPYKHFSETFRSLMSDRERDIIENKVERALKQLLNQLEVLKQEVIHGNELPDSVESRKGVLMILFQQMDAVSAYFQTQRKKRVQQDKVTKEGWFFMAEGEHIPLWDKKSPAVPRTESQRKKNVKSLTEEDIQSAAEMFDVITEKEEKSSFTAQLQLENQELAKELESKVDQVRLVEKQVVEIGTLQETFSTKVEEQAEEIESLHQLAVESTSHVTHAKGALQDAADNGINFRLFVIVLILTTSFQLIMVHLYN